MSHFSRLSEPDSNINEENASTYSYYAQNGLYNTMRPVAEDNTNFHMTELAPPGQSAAGGAIHMGQSQSAYWSDSASYDLPYSDPQKPAASLAYPLEWEIHFDGAAHPTLDPSLSPLDKALASAQSSDLLRSASSPEFAGEFPRSTLDGGTWCPATQHERQMTAAIIPVLGFQQPLHDISYGSEIPLTWGSGHVQRNSAPSTVPATHAAVAPGITGDISSPNPPSYVLPSTSLNYNMPSLMMSSTSASSEWYSALPTRQGYHSGDSSSQAAPAPFESSAPLLKPEPRPLTTSDFLWITAVLDPKHRRHKNIPTPTGQCIFCDIVCKRPGTLQQHVIYQHRQRTARKIFNGTPYDLPSALAFTAIQLKSDPDEPDHDRQLAAEGEIARFEKTINFEHSDISAEAFPLLFGQLKMFCHDERWRGVTCDVCGLLVQRRAVLTEHLSKSHANQPLVDPSRRLKHGPPRLVGKSKETRKSA